MNTQNAGIDYGNGTTNIDAESGIRYGVIPAYAIGSAWYERSEAKYGEPTCPQCGNVAVEYDDEKHGEYNYDEDQVCDYACETCEWVFAAEHAFPESPYAIIYAQDGYQASQEAGDYATSDDIFITLSPFYTYAGFCSPCAPGAGYLRDAFTLPHTYEEDRKKLGDALFYSRYGRTISTLAKNAGFPRVYCFGHDWFEDGKAPYPVYSVETGLCLPLQQRRIRE